MTTVEQAIDKFQEQETKLQDILAECYGYPERFVRLAYPWGQAGPLAHHAGPDDWQEGLLREIGQEVRSRAFKRSDPIAVAPIREAVASGHGIGKSTEVAWITDWIMSTRPGAQGTITANTAVQLETKTWAAIQFWTKMCITSHWWHINSSKMARIGREESWFCTPQTCREENSEAFAGQHAVSSTSFYIFDEASAVPDSIFEVAEGGLTDGEPMVFAFGNPTRNSGKFHRVCFGSERDRWNHRSIDSRECKLSNKTLIKEWVEDYGEDSDFVRVRVRGLPPTADELQYIDSVRVEAAKSRPVEVLDDEPIVCGMDVSGGGSAWNVFRFRRGLDGRSLPAIRITGQAGRDRAILIARAAEILRDGYLGQRIAMMFVDSAFGSPIVERLHSLGYENVTEVNFGGDSPDIHFENQRAFMWSKMKDWLPRGAIDTSEDLALGLCSPGYHMNKRNKLVLESKESMAKRGVASPDDADALALTFAQPVARIAPRAQPRQHSYAIPQADGWQV